MEQEPKYQLTPEGQRRFGEVKKLTPNAQPEAAVTEETDTLPTLSRSRRVGHQLLTFMRAATQYLPLHWPETPGSNYRD